MQCVGWLRARAILFACIFGFTLHGCGGGSSEDPGGIRSVRITPGNTFLAPGGTAAFTAEALTPSGTVLANRAATFTLSDPSVARLDNPSANPVTVTGLANGTTTLTATIGGVSSGVLISVTSGASQAVVGKVVDGVTGAALAGARLLIGDRDSGASSGADGGFSLILTFPSGSAEVQTITARRTGYVDAPLILTRNGLTVTGTPPVAALEPILMVPAGGGRGSIVGVLRNAVDGSAIGGQTVSLYRGQGDGASLPSVSRIDYRIADSGGAFSFTELEPGTYTLASAPLGFLQCTRSAVTIDAANTTVQQDVVCSKIESRRIRIVLTWGTAPADLDSHLTGPDATGPGRFHVFYASRGTQLADGATNDTAPFAGLDLDDTNGAGPETITLRQLNAGVYRYSVHDFTNRNSATSTALASSGARVELYLPGNLGARQFFVPNERGTLWAVFELNGSIENPTVTVRNEMGLATEPTAVP